MGVCTSAKSNDPRTGGSKNNISTKNSNNTKSEGNKQCIVSSNTITSNGDIIHNRKCIRQKNHHYTVRAPNIKLKDLVSTSKVKKEVTFEQPIQKEAAKKETSEFQLYDTNTKEDKKTTTTINGTASNPRPNFRRKAARSISLIEKNKLGSHIFKEELKLTVTTQALIEETKGLPNNKYQVIKKIGDGSYGMVYLAQNLITKGNVALKRIMKNGELPIDDIEVSNEFEIVKKIDHPFIVKILEVYVTKNAYYIINEFCRHGELYSQIKMKFTEEQLSFMFYQIFCGLNYLHTNNIVHRDLKLENILITDIETDPKTKLKYLWLKIIDFGAAKFFSKNTLEKTVVGSSYYIAPEVLKKKYNEKCDTWSAGVMLHMFLVGKAPFDGEEDDEILMKIKQGKFNTKNTKFLNSSKEVQDLIKKLLEVKVDKRLSAREALQHPWFVKYNAKKMFYSLGEDKIRQYVNRLIRYKINSKFQQIILAFIVHNINNTQEIIEIKKIFAIFDKDADGRLTKEELYEGLCRYEKEETITNIIDDLFIVLNGSNNEYIQFEEFVRGCLNKKELLTDQLLTYAFKFIDKDNTGLITPEKLKVCFGNTSSQVVTTIDVFKAIISEVSHSNDDQVNYEEFKQMMLNF